MKFTIIIAKRKNDVEKISRKYINFLFIKKSINVLVINKIYLNVTVPNIASTRV